MLLSSMIDSKFINNEGGRYGSGFVGPESWGEFNRLISVFLRVIFKSVMYNSSRLWKTIHEISNIDIDYSVVKNIS